MKKFVLAGLVLIAVLPACAQNVRFNDVVQAPNGSGLVATITLCAIGSTGTPCTPASTVYLDAAGTMPVTSVTSGPLGDYFFYAPSGRYVRSITGPSITSVNDEIVVPCTSAQPCKPSSIGQVVSVMDFGAKANCTTDDRAAIQAAIDSISTGIVYLPPTTTCYLITPIANKTKFLALKSGVQLVGIGNPILKVAASSAPYDYIINSGVCDDCVIQGLTIDSNIAANPITNLSEIQTHPRIEIQLAGGKRIKVDQVTIKNSSSVNSIVTGYVSSDVRITNCLFYANGDDPNHIAHDASALYIVSDGAVIEGNIFRAVARQALGIGAAIETHGSKMTVIGNVITDYAGGMNITGIDLADTIDTVVSGNTITGALSGIGISSSQYSTHTTGYGINGLAVTGNTIIVNQTSYTVAAFASRAVYGIFFDAAANLPVKNVTISDNTVSFDLEGSVRTGSTASIGIGWWSSGAQTAQNFTIANNVIDNAPVAGIRLAAVLQGLRVSDNIIRNAGSSLDGAIAAGYKTPIFIAGAPATDVEIMHNQIVDNLDPSRTVYGILLSTTAGTTTGLRVQDNSVTLLGTNQASFAGYVTLSDNNTKPFLVDEWDGFTAPANQVAPGSQVTDSKNSLLWIAGASGLMLSQPLFTAPTISPASGFNTGTVTRSKGTNSIFSIVITVGSTGTVSTGTLGLPTAALGWNCSLTNQNRAAVIQQTSNTTSTAVLTNFGTTFAATNWTNGDVLTGYCAPN